MLGDDKARDEEHWRALISRLSTGQEPPVTADALAPAFDDPTARKRVGLVITKAVLGEPLYSLYQIYCGNPSPRV